ncbi:MAG: Asp-tRNA(Asn)/Glu-tRNA(Gln) amidotransferase subunit GatB [Candidatus Levybacteria bacterium]|nr:Asp-tRNA(Asn)/Glu-tRNA(Gln) amidotransferase subunit GatB [Candidatus Levybacteria bacterium]
MSKYIPIIGLEVHVELKTKSKMFCGCSADYFGKEPNTHTCPVCLGLPGALPIPNKQAIEWCIKIALALGCEINLFSKFDRKNYFYHDLPKGYQISQYDLPFGTKGSIVLSNGKTIGITRVHMEEDTGKLSHHETNGVKTSLVDFNRSGVPLVEIVTEPDFHDAKDVVEYLQMLRSIVRYLDVSNADMEKGDMRLEPNISLSTDPTKLPNYKVEVKNINSFRFVDKAIAYEIKRHEEILERGETPIQETRGWNENKNATFSQRVKEEANDYRYFPEPDIPPIRHTQEAIDELKKTLPELQTEKIARFTKEYSLPAIKAEILTREKSRADEFENAVKLGQEKGISPEQIANMIINRPDDLEIHVNNTIHVEALLQRVELENKREEISEEELKLVIQKVIADNPKAVEDYKSGKESVIMFLVGQCMRAIGRKVDANIVKQSLIKALT